MDKIEHEHTAEAPFGIPSRQDVFLGGVFFILVAAILRIASDILMPMMAAILLTFALQPVQRFLQKLRIPAYASAFLIIILLVGGIVSLGSALATPASNWAAQIPGSLPELKGKFRFLAQPVEKTKRLVTQAEDMANGADQKATPVAVQGSRLFDRLVTGASTALGSMLTMLLMLFFFLAAGDIFVRRMIEVLPGFRNKRHVVDIFHHIESDVNRYLLTITMMNMLVGLAAGLIMWSYNIGDPVLWGMVAFLLNFVPIMGPITAVAIFLIVSFMQIDDFWTALMPPALFLCAHIMESTGVTPRLLARQFTINPLIVILGLVFWYWMWGLAGALMSMPMIMVAKIVCGRIDGLKPVGHLLEG